jgi:hypothetical protein
MSAERKNRYKDHTQVSDQQDSRLDDSRGKSFEIEMIENLVQCGMKTADIADEINLTQRQLNMVLNGNFESSFNNFCKLLKLYCFVCILKNEIPK